MRVFIFLVVTMLILSCKNDKSAKVVSNKEKANKTEVIHLKGKALEVYDFEGFKSFLNKNDDKTYVINFWATWCAPCVKELPHFEEINKKYKDKSVEVILVSLDFPHLYEKKLKPFIKEKQLVSKVIALDDADMNSWIPQVDSTWSGALPATIIYKNEKRKFFEKSFTFEALESELKSFLN